MPEFSSRRVLSRHPAASTTTRAFTCISRREWRSMKCAPLARPVFLSVVISRTMALGTMSSLPVASASGSSRLIELASPFCPCAERPLRTADAALRRQVDHLLDRLAVRRIVRSRRSCHRETAASLPCARHPEDAFDPRVIRIEIGEADRPVVAGAIELRRLEFEIAQAEGFARPEQRSPAEQAHTHPVIGFAGSCV